LSTTVLEKKSDTPYTQCTLEKVEGDRTIRQTSWLPTKFAKKGKVLKLREDKFSEWTDGWVVILVGETRDDRPYPSSDIMAHRNRTGDSMPKPKSPPKEKKRKKKK
jgi:hypothetical protein